MVALEAHQMKGIAPLFQGIGETLIWSCLQGCMGRAWADSAEAPTAAQIITGDFCFVAGDSRSPGAYELAGHIPADYRSSVLILAPPDPGWASLVEAAHAGRWQRQTRYALQKSPNVFDPNQLRALVGQVPPEYQIQRMEERVYHACLAQEWSADFCSQFSSYADYQARGLGFAALLNGEPVAGASSYTVYRGGIEIEVDTKPGYRRKGLAAACAAALILKCLHMGLYPSWDAANTASLALAQKLGYHFSHEYPVYHISTSR
ncbi:MAG: GNAT family N-acetyltransferase [Oscillospiraceae bacterium]